MKTSIDHELGFEVYSHDLDGYYTWDEALKTVEAIGDGWRLPTKEELCLMQRRRTELTGFYHGRATYWSSTEEDELTAWHQHFLSGMQTCAYKTHPDSVRPVRDLPPSNSGSTYMKRLLNDETEKHYIAYAVGYADGNAKGVDERKDIFPTPEERYLYGAGYERGLSDFCYRQDYGMFED